MADYQKEEFKFGDGGMNLALPIDSLPPNQYAILKNLRGYQGQRLEVRPGLALRNPGVTYDQTNVHSFRRLNTSVPGDSPTSALIVGAGTKLYQDQNGAAIDTGYSGNPLTMLPFRPSETVRPWMYVGDSLKMSKTKVGATFARSVGTTSPNADPVVNFGASNFNTISDTSAIGNWANTGAAGALTVVNRINDTIKAIVYDSGTTGWASIALNAPDNNTQPGAFVTLGGSDEVLIQSVYTAIKSTTVSAIQYDSGSTGACWVVLADNVNKLILDYHTMLQISAEYVVVTAVSWGRDGLPAIRTTTTGAHANGEVVTGVVSFRTNCAGAHVAGNTAISQCLQSAATGGSAGSIVKAKISLNEAHDLSTAGGRPIAPEDFFHISYWISDVSQVQEIMIFLDIDAVPANQDLFHNSFLKVFGPNDFAQTAVDGTSLTQLQQRVNNLQNRLQAAIAAQNAASKKGQARINRLTSKLENVRSQISDLGGDKNLQFSSQTTIGSGQWSEMFISVAELYAGRIGSDMTRDLGNVDRLQIKTKLTGPVTIQIADLWIGGTYGPDVGDIGTPYKYRYRYRASETGVVSTVSPELRTGISPHRERVILTPGAYSTDPQMDQVQWERFGGSLNEYHFVGTQPNSGSFSDDYLDDEISALAGFPFDDYQPFVIQDLPRSGTCNVVGCSIKSTGGTDAFNTNWAEGTIITLGPNATVYTLSGPPPSTTLLFIKQNAGVQTGVNWKINTPILTGVSLPVIFGPYGYGQAADYMFGVGDLKNAGRLYYTKGNNFDASSDRSWNDVTSPSEPLMAGGVYQGQIFLGSSDRMFIVIPAFASDVQGNPLPNFVAQEIPNSKGVINNWSLAVGHNGVFFVSGDGIYVTYGTTPTSITDAALYPLFPHEGIPGVTTNGIIPPDFTQLSFQRLAYAEGYVYYTFKDTGGNINTLVYNTNTGAWDLDTYTPNMLTAYEEEGSGIIATTFGGNNGQVYKFTTSGTSDNGSPIACQMRSRAFDMGENRIKKNFGDGWIDCDTGGVAIAAVIGFDNYSATQASQSVTQSGRGNTPLDIADLSTVLGTGRLARNAVLDLTWSLTSAVFLYAHGWSYVPKTEDFLRRYTDGSELGDDMPAFLQGFRLHANTFGVNKSITVQLDNGSNGAWTDVPGATFTINHAQESRIDYSLPVASFASSANIGHRARLKMNDAIPAELLEDVIWIYEPSPPLVTHYRTQGTTHDLEGYSCIRSLQISLISGDLVTLTIITDEGTTWSQSNIYDVPSTAGGHQKIYMVSAPQKGKEWIYDLSSPVGFRVFEKDCEVWVKQWGSEGPFQPFRPFGETSRVRGAVI